MLKSTPYVGSCARGSHVSLFVCVPSNWRHIVVARYHLIGYTCLARTVTLLHADYLPLLCAVVLSATSF